jgi:hypothetical protein
MSFSSYVSDTAFIILYDLNYHFLTFFPTYDVN